MRPRNSVNTTREELQMNVCWKFIGRVAMVLGIVLGLALAEVHAEDKLWTRSAILAIADGEASRLGYDVEKMSVSFNTYNSKWRDHLARAEKDFVPLKDRDYWAVYYAPLKKRTRGADLWIFIDRETDEIITVLRGQ